MDLSLLIRATVGGVAERHELTATQGRLLCLLEHGPLRMADLAQRLGVEKAALTGLVDRAERRALVERRAVPGDRRATHVSLTSRGATAMTSFHADVADALDAMLGTLGPEEREAFRRMARVVVDGAGAPAAVAHG
ncbi:transcriptional regulator, MarR family [Beutenbergia cavernae DSM 12333]|uniref:Transcriptional regulator, MarR family n=1 Tax=Beutenbergia cavernae (strain ATCC BAA-8 / DSM 12333 / CCUG 43141 / JCM 11478 / NBRC 16432 / NCIMB 13614 / HKI 0122) TaxID=471853 RepID=C5C633_BEUC1|nr:transcriptional regulator, MarR family [Beutenbergia cavernae DSM 12333]